MSKADKLIQKLKNGSISAPELRTLMKKVGARLVNVEGSHERWYFNEKRLTLAAKTKDLKIYQIKQAQQFLGVSDE